MAAVCFQNRTCLQVAVANQLLLYLQDLPKELLCLIEIPPAPRDYSSLEAAGNGGLLQGAVFLRT